MANILSTKSLSDQDQPSTGTKLERYVLTALACGLAFPLLATLIKLLQLRLPINPTRVLAVQGSEPLLWIIDTAPLVLALVAWLMGRREDRLLETIKGHKDRQAELTSIGTGLEQLLLERTNELQERNTQMRASVYFTRQISETQEMSSLLKKTVELISQQFGHYYAGLILLDDEEKSAVLQAASSEMGRTLLGQGYQVSLDDQTIVARAIERAKLFTSNKSSGGVWSNAGEYGTSRTESEIALPLIARGKVIGVLDIQSERAEAFDENEAELLQLLADQVGACIDNSRLLTRSQAFISQLEILTTKQTQSTWQEYLKNQNLAYQFTPVGVKSIAPGSGAKNNLGLQIPLRLRGQEIGAITLQRKDQSEWSSPERDLAEKVSLQVALALDNSRLLEETRQHAVQEQTVNAISARLNRSLDVDTLLQTAVRELAALPEVSEASVFIKPTDQDKYEKQQ